MAEMENYNLDTLFASLDLKEFDAVIFAPRTVVVPVCNGNLQERILGEELKELVVEKLPSVEPDFISGLITEAAGKYKFLSWEKRVVVGLLTSKGAEEFSRKNPDAYVDGHWVSKYFKVPAGLDFVGIAAEGDPLSITKNHLVRIESEEFGTMCGVDSSGLTLKAPKAGYGVLGHSTYGGGIFDCVGEGAGEGASKLGMYVERDAGSGFMRNTVDSSGYVGGNADSGAAGGSEGIDLLIKGNCGDLLLDGAKDNHGAVDVLGNAGNYACYGTKGVTVNIGGTAGKFLGEKMADGRILIETLDTYHKPEELLGRGGSGRIFIKDGKSREYALPEKKGFEIMAGKFSWSEFEKPLIKPALG